MNARRGVAVQVIVANAGPLISLAARGRLALLGAFGRPAIVPDVVRAECLRRPDGIGAEVLSRWFEADGGVVRIAPTPLMRAWEDAIAADEAAPDGRQAVGLGDAAIAWLLRQVEDGAVITGPTLVLTEDAPFGDGMPRDRFPEVHVLSTRAFLRALENFGLIGSAEAIVEEIAAAGRALARYLADRPGRPEPGVRTTWAEVLRAEE